MELLDLFHKWVPLYLRLPVLFLMFFVILVANGIFLGNANEISNTLGVYSEPFTEAYNALYIGMGLGLIFHYRLKLRFTNKTLLLFGLTMQLLMNIVCATTSNTVVFVAACLIIGFVKISGLIEVYVIWMYIWSKKLDTSRLYPFVYFTALSGIYFMFWLTTWLAFNYNWRFSYIWVLILLLVCLLAAVLLVENNKLKRPLPLYQMDYPGIVLLATSMLLLNYATVNGKVEDWFESKWISAACIGSLLCFLLFIRRQLHLKRPMFDLTLFKKATFRRGLFYFMALGIFLPGTFQSAFTGGVLQYDAITSMELNIYLIPGIMSGCVFCYFWYFFKRDPEILIIAGFACFVIYHIFMYNYFSTSLSLDYFLLPSFIKGFATALIYISVGLLTTKDLQLDRIISAAGAMIMVRSFLGSGIFGAFYSYFLYTQRIRHLDYLASSADAVDFRVYEAGKGIYAQFQEQATLAASKELTGLIIIAGIILLVYLVVRYFYLRLLTWLSTRPGKYVES
jgi:DHA2 family multidrug resistance protein